MSAPKSGAESIDPAYNSRNPSGPGSSKDSTDSGIQHTENTHRASVADGARKASVAAKLRNPLAGMTEQAVLNDVDIWVEEKGLAEHRDVFRKGALIARVGQRDDGFEYVSQLTEEEKGVLRHEIQHRWSQPFMLYFLVILCAGSAIVQGMDQTAVNGAQVGHHLSEIMSFSANVSSSFISMNLISQTNGNEAY